MVIRQKCLPTPRLIFERHSVNSMMRYSVIAAISGEGIELHVSEPDNSDVCLSWSLRFAARSARGSEVEKVWGTVSIYEADPMTAKVWRRAEIFQIGARPRWE